MDSLQAFVPSLHVGRLGSVTLVTLRGVGIENVTITGDPSVLFEVDGIPLGRPTAAVSVFHDLERVEVHRGPQGTGGGRSVTGGRIALYSAAPAPGFEAGGDLQVGTRSQLRTRGVLNVPLYRDSLLSRLSIVTEHRDGYTSNAVTGDRDDHADDARNVALRAQLRALPAPGFDLRLVASWAQQKGVGFALNPLSRADRIVQGCPRLPVCPPETLPPAGEVLFTTDPRVATPDIPGDRDNFQLALTTLWSAELPELPLLGGLRLRGSAGWHRNVADELRDLDGFNAPLSFQDSRADARQRVIDARLERDTEILGWRIGIFHYRERIRERLQVEQGRFIFSGDFAFSRIDTLRDFETDEVAFFASATLAPVHGLRLFGGIRYTRTTKTVETSSGGFFENLPFSGIRVEGRRSFDAWTPRIGAEADLGEHVVVGGSVTRGYKPGGFDLGGSTSSIEFPEETLWTLEAFARGAFFDERLQLELTLFHSRYSNYQSCQITAIAFTCASGEAEIQGVEVELGAEPLDGLRLDGNLAALDSEIVELFQVDPELSLGDRAFGRPIELRGRRLPRAPRFSLQLGLQYEIGLGRYGALTPRLQYRYQTRTYFRAFNRRDFSQPAYSQVDVRLAWRSADERFSAEVFVDNASDEDVINNLFLGGLLDESPVFASYLPPRVWGLRLGFRY